MVCKPDLQKIQKQLDEIVNAISYNTKHLMALRREIETIKRTGRRHG